MFKASIMDTMQLYIYLCVCIYIISIFDRLWAYSVVLASFTVPWKQHSNNMCCSALLRGVSIIEPSSAWSRFRTVPWVQERCRPRQRLGETIDIWGRVELGGVLGL